MLDRLTSDMFRPHLDESFLIHWADPGVDAAPLEVALIEVADLGTPPPDGQARRRPFSLIFRHAQASTYLPQRIYTLEHPALGQLDLFLVPIGTDAVGMQYQAIFT